jgi:[NiFe] hydrogenase diaphorase moiety large subunit
MLILEKNAMTEDIEQLVAKFGNARSALLPILQGIQRKHKYIPDFAQQEVARLLDIHPVEVYSVISFYAFLNTKPKGRNIVRLCQTVTCDLAGKNAIAKTIQRELGIKFGETTKDNKFTLEYVNCLGMCDQGPALIVNEQVYSKLTPEKALRILTDVKRGDFTFEKTKRKGAVLFSEYKRGEGIKKALAKTGEQILNEVRESKLKGRGGAGFPTATKWALAASAKAEKRYVICNADEGEPGTFKDRVLLLEYPELVFDGMVIAGYTIGAQNGIIYLRGEYEYMKKTLEDYLDGMRRDNLLGNNILGRKDFNFDITTIMGSGAYVCGEETALIESLEGQRGEARNRPPFPVNTGFMGNPTTVNNVETLAAIPHIILKGGGWFKKYGTDKSSGSKLFSVSGDCEKPGVYELQWGTKISDLLELVGAKNVKAVQVGGASGICIPKSQFDRTLSYEDAATGGSIIIFNEKRDMLHVLHNFMEFFVDESCGQCTPCRIGNKKLLEGVEMIKNDEFTFSYIAQLKELGRTMQVASKCGLGQSSSNSFISILENFKEEILSKVSNSAINLGGDYER